MVDSILEWMRNQESVCSYMLLGVASMLEYMIPPIPGDVITLLGVFLAASAHYNLVWVYVAINLGALIGSVVTYGVGYKLSFWPESSRPTFLRTPRVLEMLRSFELGYAHYGTWVLLANRFVPAFRAFVFVGAGLARIPLWKVALFGTVSAVLWNGLLLALAVQIGRNWHTLVDLLKRYNLVAFALVAAFIAGVMLYKGYRKKKSPET